MSDAWQQFELDQRQLAVVRGTCAAFTECAASIERTLKPERGRVFLRYYVAVVAKLRQRVGEILADVDAGGSTLTAVSQLDQLHAELLTAHDRMHDHLSRSRA